MQSLLVRYSYRRTRECNLSWKDMITVGLENAISTGKIWLITVGLENVIFTGKIWLITIWLSILVRYDYSRAQENAISTWTKFNKSNLTRDDSQDKVELCRHGSNTFLVHRFKLKKSGWTTSMRFNLVALFIKSGWPC